MNTKEEIYKQEIINNPKSPLIEIIYAAMESYALSYHSHQSVSGAQVLVDALEYLMKGVSELPPLSAIEGVLIPHYNKAKEALQKFKSHPLSSVSDAVEWIDVKDKLPEIPPPYIESDVRYKPLDVRVIVYDGDDVFEESFCDGKFGGTNNEFITHWQPLPEPPKK